MKKTVLSVVAVVTAVAVLGLVAAPHFVALLVAARFRGERAGPHRRRVAAWQVAWGDRVFRIVCAVLRIDVELRTPCPLVTHAMPPSIVVANHRSTLDILLVMSLLRRMGRDDVRWVLKRELRAAPLVGVSCAEAGCAFVARARDGRDLDEIASCAGLAHADGASVVLFPEGTRFVRPREGGPFTRVLPPKVRGFSTLVERMPGHAVLSVTLYWDVGDDGRTMFDTAAHVGRRVIAEATFAEVPVGRADEWLAEEWVRKDRRLAELGG